MNSERGVLSSMLLVVFSVSGVWAGTVGYVTSDGVLDKPFDVVWAERLETQGHTVIPLPQTFDPTTGPGATADFFIVSSDVNSGDFVQGGINPDVEFFDFQGSAWFGGGDLDAGFAGGPPRLFTLNPVDLTGRSNVRLSLLAAARPTGWDEGQDFIFFNLDVDGDNNFETPIADFEPINGDMEDTIGGTILNEIFQEITFPIPANVTTLRFQIDALSTAGGEQFGIDNIRVTADNGATLIGVEDFEGGAGKIGFTAEGRGGAGAAFWDVFRADAPATSPRVADPRPIINYEPALYDELGVGESGTQDFQGTTIDIEDPSHPLAAGLKGSVAIYDFDQVITRGGDPPAAGTKVIATADGLPAIAVLEQGAESRDGSPAPGLRVTVFVDDDGDSTLYTDAGWQLLDAAVEFVSGGPPVPGDFDGNGVLDLADINALLGAVAGGGPASFDVTNDGQVNQADLDTWVNSLFNSPKGTWIGDANLDKEFNTGDLVQIFQAGKFEQNVQAGWHEGDWTGNLRFGTEDLVAAFQAGGFERGPKAATSAVPEPSSMLLAGLAFVGLGVIRRRAPV